MPETGISGYASWGSLALSVFILSWLFMKYLPDQRAHEREAAAAKDKVIERMFEVFNKATDQQRQEFLASLTEAQAIFREESAAERNTFERSLKSERESCEKHFERLANVIGESHKSTASMIAAHNERNRQWVELLNREIAAKQALLDSVVAKMENMTVKADVYATVVPPTEPENKKP